MKYQLDYFDEFVTIYEQVTSLMQEDIGILLDLKSQYLEFIDKGNKFYMFDIILDKSEKEFLKTRKINNFKDEQQQFELLLRKNYKSNIDHNYCYAWSCQYGHHFSDRFDLAQYKFMQNNGEEFKYSLLEHKTKTILSSVQQAIECKQKIIQENNKTIPKKQKKILKKDKDYIYAYVNQQFQEYLKVVDNVFFEIKDVFLFYDKELIVYLTTKEKNDSNLYRIILQLYKSDIAKITVDDHLLFIFTVDFNNKELGSQSLGNSFTLIPKEESNKNYGFKQIIDNNGPYYEVLELYWSLADEVEKIEFINNIFKLLGKRVEPISCINFSHKIFKLTNFDINIDIIQEGFNRRCDTIGFNYLDYSYLIFGNKNYFNEDSLSQIKQEFDENNLDQNYKYLLTIGHVSQYPNELFNKFKIKVLTLRELTNLLLEHDLFPLLKPLLIKTIKAKNNAEIQGYQNILNEGNKFIDQLTNIKSKQVDITWAEFQKLGENIFEFIFKSSFKHYIAKSQSSSDSSRQRIPDLVISNTNPFHDFWKSRKHENNSKRIVIDFKNYSKEISGDVVDDVAKYLNKQQGNFAIIVSIYNLNKSGIERQKYLYYNEDKLILCLDLKDLIQMINYKINKQEPEEILEKKLAEIC